MNDRCKLDARSPYPPEKGETEPRGQESLLKTLPLPQFPFFSKSPYEGGFRGIESLDPNESSTLAD